MREALFNERNSSDIRAGHQTVNGQSSTANAVVSEYDCLSLRIKYPDCIHLPTKKLLHTNHRGEELGIAYEDSDFGMMQLRGETFGVEDGRHYVEWTMCYPASCTKDELIEHIYAHVPEGGVLDVISH